MTTRTAILESARRRPVLDGLCPTCLGDLAEWPDQRGKVYCPRCQDFVYEPTTGEVQEKIT